MGISTASKTRRKQSTAAKTRQRKRKSSRPVAPVTAVNSRAHNEADIIRLGRHVSIIGAGKGKVLARRDVGSARPRRGLMGDLLTRSRALGNKASLRLTSKEFGSKWRALMSNQDELFSTASARGFIQGIIDGDKSQRMSGADEALIITTVELISQLRVPTEFVGFSSKSLTMQHPTTEGEGIFADSKGDAASLHSQLDAARAEQVGIAMADACTVKGANAQSIVYAGMRRAISFTLNEMMAPILAADVRPHSLRGPKTGKPSDVQTKQMAAREQLKKIFTDLGGKLRVGSAGNGGLSRGRDWTPSQGKNLREPSPERSTP